MDKNIKSFSLVSIFILSLLGALLLIFIYFYKYSTINTYNFIILILIVVTCLIILLFTITIIVFYNTYQKRLIVPGTGWALNLGLKFSFPFIIGITKLVKGNKDLLRKFYIIVNNIYVASKNTKFKSEEILVILPHCLQNSDCRVKVTNDVNQCVKCGKCNIGEILSLTRKYGVNLKVVTGGTVARSIVKNYKPRLILSVACERDLLSGILDVGSIPVIGIINERPNGPCFNTFVNISELERKLIDFLYFEKKPEE